MEKLRGHGLRDDAIGVMQVTETIAEVLINGWWIITVEDCMTNDHGHGYFLELMVNNRKLNLQETGFETIDHPIDGLFVKTWHHVQLFLGWNIDYLKDMAPSRELKAFVKCGWCDSETYPHICESSLTEALPDIARGGRLSTANASAPKPPKVTQEDQDKIDMAKAAGRCSCTSQSKGWLYHWSGCDFYKEGQRIQARKDRIQRWRDRSMSA